MKLIFDLTVTQPIGEIKYHGGGKYGEIVFKSLVGEVKTDIIAYIDSKRWLNPEIELICKNANLEIVDASITKIKDIVNRTNCVVYSPLISDDFTDIGADTTYITTIHGLRVLEMPYDSYAKYYYKRSYLSFVYGIYFKRKARKLFNTSLLKYREIYKNKNIHTVTVSEHSKASILTFVPELSAEKIKVFYSPSTVDRELNKRVEIYKKEKYFLIVGANRWIKNAIRAIKAFDELFNENVSLAGKVIITGVTQRHIFLKHLKHKERFEFLEYVNDSQLASLYKGAHLLVYPSLNEGFGYPPLEAMSYGTPVIASAISSLTEIGGNAVLYFSPFSINEIKMRIIQMEDITTYKIFAEKCLRRSHEVSEYQQRDLDSLVSYIQSFLK